jgi:hypothetical protein
LLLFPFHSTLTREAAAVSWHCGLAARDVFLRKPIDFIVFDLRNCVSINYSLAELISVIY